MNNIKKLGEYLARVLDEDQFKSAEDFLIKIDKEILDLQVAVEEDKQVIAGMTKQHTEVSEYLQTEVERLRGKNASLDSVVEYWFNSNKNLNKEMNLLKQIVGVAEDYIGDDSKEKDSIDFWNTLYKYRGDNEGDCPNCKQGTVKELSIYDDMDGMLTCDKCGVRVKN